jgi:hypothetical protein
VTTIPESTGLGDLFFQPDRIGKLIRLLSSPLDGEVVGAARALGRVLADQQADFHTLADCVERNWRGPISTKPDPIFWNPPRRPEWQIRAERLLAHSEILFPEYPDEFDFLMNVSRMRPAPSAGQEKWMRDIEDAIARGINIEQRRRERAYARTA